MRILYHHRTMADGAEGVHIREVVLALRSLGHDVRVVALAGDPSAPPHPRTQGRSGLGVLRRLIPDPAYELAELAYNPVGRFRLMQAIRSFRPDVVYDRYNSYSTAALSAARRSGLPLLLEVNAPVAYERTIDDHLTLRFPGLARRYERRICQGADRIFAVSTPLKRHLVETLGVRPDKIVVLPNGANPDVFHPGIDGTLVRRRYGLENRVVIGFVGILRPWHGVELLLQAFAELRPTSPAAHLLIVGDGPIRHDLELRVRDLALGDAVTFTGRLPHDAVASHIAAMDIAVSPHATFYASPMKILEYMAMAKAVVAPDMENIRDIIVNGQAGLLFEPCSSPRLAQALRCLLGDGALRRQLGMAGRSLIVDRLNWRISAERVLDELRAIGPTRFDGSFSNA